MLLSVIQSRVMGVATACVARRICLPYGTLDFWGLAMYVCPVLPTCLLLVMQDASTNSKEVCTDFLWIWQSPDRQ